VQQLNAKPVAKPEWGSTKLEPWYPNPSEKIGEMWFEAPLAEEGDGPLLIKFLFTTAALSVQVHPNDDYAKLHHTPRGKTERGNTARGKTEMWHILAAEPGAQIAAGFKTQITPETLRDAALSGEIEQLLQWHDAHPGDTFFIPAGTVHAIGGGLVLCEIQQTSDITYRLYDYGRPRELHLDHGCQVSHLGPHAARQSAREGVLVECPYFTTEKYEIAGRKELPALGRDATLIVLKGAGEVNGRMCRAGEVFTFAPDESISINGHLAVLRTWA
jgi:mannose-6-phosphate isomerase